MALAETVRRNANPDFGD
jgi:hypothetical protein